MAVYFSQKISATGTPTALAWSRHRTTRKDPANGSTLVAVAFEDGAVGVYTEEGDPVDPNSGVAVRGERGVVPTALAWHPEPRSSLWATPTADCATGPVATDAPPKTRTCTTAAPSPSRPGPPTARASSPATPRAASACGRSTNDTAQRPCADTTGSPPAPRESPTSSSHRAKTPRRRAHPPKTPTSNEPRRAPPPTVEREARTRTARRRRRAPPRRYFYYAVAADGGGAVLRADDRGGSARLIEADAEFTVVLHRDGAGELVTLGVDATLSIHRAGSRDGDAPWTTASSTKLPCDTPAAATWAAPGTLAVVNERDPSCAVRVFDLDSGENYTLLPPQASRTGVAADPSGGD